MSKIGKPTYRGSTQNLTRGLEGEELAVRHLKRLGYRIICRNYRCPLGEIDIIACDNKVLCFIEVKSRKKSDFALPEEYVDERKQKKLIKTSLIYLSKTNNSESDKRFDVISVDLESGKCRKIKNAFDADY